MSTFDALHTPSSRDFPAEWYDSAPEDHFWMTWRLKVILRHLRRLKIDDRTALEGFTSLILTILLIGGIRLICTGILGEYIGRIYQEVKSRPSYVVRELRVNQPAWPREVLPIPVQGKPQTETAIVSHRNRRRAFGRETAAMIATPYPFPCDTAATMSTAAAPTSLAEEM
jgi:hypothetical protein